MSLYSTFIYMDVKVLFYLQLLEIIRLENPTSSVLYMLFFISRHFSILKFLSVIYGKSSCKVLFLAVGEMQ